MKNANFKDLTPKMLKNLYWDANVTQDDISRILSGEIDRIGHIDRNHIYRRLLSTCDWYTTLEMIPSDRLMEALEDAVIDHLYPQSLRERYRYARTVLFG